MKKAQQATPRSFKQLPLDVPADFVLMLDAFCDAHHGAPRARVIRDAVTELVTREIDENPGLKERFEQAKLRLLKERFTVVQPTPINPQPANTD